MNTIIEATVCSTTSLACMSSECNWIRKTKIIEKGGKKIKVATNVKEIGEGTVTELTETFKTMLKRLKVYNYNIKVQYQSYRNAVDGLKENEVVLHIDLSENYSCSYHFGGSRRQVTLHTGVMYRKSQNDEKRIVDSFCSISSNNSYDSAAIWAHLHPILTEKKYRTPEKQQFTFFPMGLQHNIYQFERVTWNCFEAGHGNGAADGVGGYLKRVAVEKLATGADIFDAESFFQLLKDASKIKLVFISDDDILL
nr:unnamed protein product [Callosobruchus analis]